MLEHFKDLPDPRVVKRCDHDLTDVLVIAVCALLCGGSGFDDTADLGQAKQDWFKTFLPLRNGIPSHDTFNRVFAALSHGLDLLTRRSRDRTQKTWPLPLGEAR